MKLDDVGEVIATRTLKVHNEREPAVEIVVLLGKPRRLPEHTDYYCPYQIRSNKSEKVWYACGIDSIQALVLALSTLGVELEVLNKELGGGLTWEGDSNLGFPQLPSTAL